MNNMQIISPSISFNNNNQKKSDRNTAFTANTTTEPDKFVSSKPNSNPNNIPIQNFGIVEKGVLYRGAEPGKEGLEYLHNTLGVKTIINLENDKAKDAKENALAEKLGMKHVNIPMHSAKEPTDEEVQQFFNIIDNYPKPVYIHCRRGKDRTGYMCARFRMKYNNYSGAQAMTEKTYYCHKDVFSKYLFKNIDKKLKSDSETQEAEKTNEKIEQIYGNFIS